MRRILAWFGGTLASLVVLFGYPTSTSGAATGVAQQPISGGAPSAAASTTTSKATPSTKTTTKATTTATPAAKAATFTGDTIQTRYGPLQVEITVAKSSITKVSVLQYPHSNGRDVQINGYALPILIQETTPGHSAKIQMVGGATYTSAGYTQSLQSALDQAGI